MRKKKYDWSAVDWTKPNKEIAADLGASNPATSAARRRYAPGTRASRKPALPCRRGDITAFLESRVPGDVFWLEGTPVDAWGVIQSCLHRTRIEAKCERFDAAPRRKSYGPPLVLTRVTILALRSVDDDKDASK